MCFKEAHRQLLVTLNTATLHRRGAEAARRAHNPEVTRSRRVAGILQFARFTETGRQSLVTLNTATLHRCGAEASAQGS